MQARIVIFLAVVCLGHALDIDGLFSTFKTKFEQTYSRTEELTRKLNLASALKYISDHNIKGNSYKLGFSSLSAESPDEFRTRLGAKPPANADKNSHRRLYDVKSLSASNDTIPESFDWREKQVSSPVRDQGRCGSCWAFSTTASSEGNYALRNNAPAQDLAEQQLVDCATRNNGYNNNGCNGGWPPDAFKYLVANGQADEASYPYNASDGQCKYTKEMQKADVIDYKELPNNAKDEDIQRAVMENGPVSVAVHANQQWQHYNNESGVMDQTHCIFGVICYSPCNLARANHAVTIIGWGVDDDGNGKKTPYWIIKNSWGEKWGKSGYIWLRRGKNMCHVNEYVSFATSTKQE